MDYDCNGEREYCADLLGFRVEEVRTALDGEINEQCGHGVQACAKLNFTTGVCTIYMPRRVNVNVRRHERNHCKGWQHKPGQNHTWFPMEIPKEAMS